MTSRMRLELMPYAVSPYTSSLPTTPNYAKRPRSPHFGLGGPSDLTSRQLEAYQKAILQSFPELQSKYGRAIDMKGGYNRLFFEMKKKVDQTAQVITPQDIINYKKRDLFGHVEESVDAMFELWELRAIQNKWITQEQAKHWASILQDYRKEGKPFQDYFSKIQNELPQASVEQFQEMTRLSGDQAKQMLALIGGKMGMFIVDFPKFDMMKNTKPLLLDEIHELFEHQKGPSVAKAVLSTIGWLYTNVPFLPARLFDRVMLGYMNHRTGMAFQFNDVTPLTWYKTANRQDMQYMHYYQPDRQGDFKKDYDLRKTYYKAYEIMLEAGIL
jgi:hypothetical protein